MAEQADSWYVRLPDGRVLRARSTAAVRHHLESGRIPPDSRVRRSSRDAWVRLEAREEFRSLIAQRARSAPPRRRRRSKTRPQAAEATRPTGQAKGLGLRTVDVPRFVKELLKALDGALVRGRLLIAAGVGLTLAALWVVLQFVRPGQELWAPLPWLGAGVLALGVMALGACLITQITFVELSQLRPATRGEVRARLARNALRLWLALLVVVGLTGLLIAGLGWLQDWLTEQGFSQLVVGIVMALRLVLAVILWPVLALSLLLAPIVVIEECSALRALGQWMGLLRRRFGRAFVYQALALVLGGLISLPLLLPVELGGWLCSAELADPVVSVTFGLLWGLALMPLLAYLAVANVFIYLNLKYEQAPAR
ncbi:MAG: hypothetical protein L0Z62_42325 [Gemmataceae bacterium]|nr:hypothetical protein [Gemmataceae bacterium]